VKDKAFLNSCDDTNFDADFDFIDSDDAKPVPVVYNHSLI